MAAQNARTLTAATLLAVTASIALSAAAQEDAPRAPRILSRTLVDPPRLPGSQNVPTLSIEKLKPPSSVPLAPLPEERQSSPDEIVVIGRGWRLPDLGSEWRARQQAAEDQQRFRSTLLPLYDPDRPPMEGRDPLLQAPEERRQGYIELFRLQFGRRSTPE
jgi:hypothetical protein